MRIMLFNTEKVINSNGGAEKVLCEMANAFVERGHQVSIAINEKISGGGKTFFYLNNKVELYNIYSRWVSLYANIRGAFGVNSICREKIRNRIKYYDRLNALINKNKPEVIIVYNLEALEFLHKSLIKSVPIIFMLHMSADYFFTVRKMSKEVWEMCDCVQVLLYSNISYLNERLNLKKIVYIPNIVEEKNLNCNYRKHKIVSVGRIHPHQKRQHLLIDAFAKLSHLDESWIIEIWGDTTIDEQYTKLLKKKISEYGLEDRIFLKGLTSDIFEKIVDASIFAMPSAYEGFSLAMTEAMSVGLPVVGYKSCTSLSELINDGENGILCDDGVDGLAKGLLTLMTNEPLREKIGKKAKEDMKSYNPESVWDKWEKLIFDVTKK